VYAAVEATDLVAFAEIRDAVLAGRALMWLALDNNRLLAVATTELRRTEHSLVCVITSCAGHLGDELHRLLGGIEDFARAEGCDYVRLFGRRGWARKLKDHYVQRHVVLERQLT
jgi:hypothetical protein